MKLGKYLAHGGIASRRKSKELILNGKVLVNGEVVTEPSYLVKKDDVVTYKDEVVEKEELVYYLVNKPRGVVSTVKDEKGRKTILDLLNDEDKDERVYPVGRLDYDSTGVLILTNDGELAYILTRPEYEVPKTYLVTAKGIITREAERKLRTGIELDGYQTKEAKVSVKEKNNQKKTSLVEITITEGKNHQVREMFKAVGFPVKSLTRTHFDFLTTEGVKRGSYRPLKIHEVKKLYVNKNKSQD